MNDKRAASLASLPEELIERICQTTINRKSYASPLRDLSNLCLTSRLLDRIARPFLYKDVELRGIGELYSFTKCVVKQPDLAKVTRSLTIEHDREDAPEDIDFDEIQNKGFRNMKQFESLVLDGASHLSLNWVLLVENLLSRTTGLTDLDINVDGSSACCYVCPENQVDNPDEPYEVLPQLRNLTIRDANETEELLAMIKSLCRNGVDSVTCLDCGVPYHIAAIEGETELAVSSSISVRKIRCYNSSGAVCPIYMPTLLRSCPHLEEFHFAIADTDDEDDGDDDEGFSDPFTAYDLMTRFGAAKKTLKSLSLTTESMGDDNGFPSLQEFESLEHLRLDVFEIADYAEGDNDHEDSDDDEEDAEDDLDELEQHLEEILTTEDHDDQQETPDAHDPEWEDIDSESESDFDSDDDKVCKPILHLLPKSLQTLWLDNLYTLDGDLDDELLKLARTAKTEFPNFRRITIEGAEELELESRIPLQTAFRKAGIEFVEKPIRHFWSVEEGLHKRKPPSNGMTLTRWNAVQGENLIDSDDDGDDEPRTREASVD